MEVKDRVAIITGAGSGVGRLLAERLLEADAKVVFVGRNLQKLNRAISECPNQQNALSVAADVSKAEDLTSLIETTLETFDGIDILVNNAGVGFAGSLPEIDPDELEYTIRVNLVGPILLTRLALPHISNRQEGMIVNITSLGALVGIPFHSPYCATKHGLRGFNNSLRRELIGTSTRVMIVYPGAMDTEMVSTEFRDTAAEVGWDVKFIRPEKAAKAIFDGIKRDKKVVHILSVQERFTRLMEKFIPFLVDRGMSRQSDKIRMVLGAANEYFRSQLPREH